MLIKMVGVLAFLSIVFLGMQMQKINSFKQEVNYTIERQGGLTSKAISDLKKVSNDTYNGMFTINKGLADVNGNGVIEDLEGQTSVSGHNWIGGMPQGQFGTQYMYQIDIKIPIPFAGIFTMDGDNSKTQYFNAQMAGTAVSKVRGR